MKRIRVTLEGRVVAELDVYRELVIGRSPSVDVQVQDGEISSRHLRVRPLDGDAVGVTDLGSTNGSFLDDSTRLAPNAEITLERGSKLMLGPAVVEVVEPAAAEERSSDFFGAEKTVAVGAGQMQAALISVARFKAAAPRVVIGAEHDRRTVAMQEMECVVGRDADEVQIEVRHASVSGKHAVLAYKDGRFEVRDLDSSNGTFVDGNRILGATTLQPETAIPFGTAECLFTCTQPASGARATPAEARVRHATAMSKATQAQARAVLDEHRRSGRLLGELFVEQGVMSPREWCDLWRQRDVVMTLGAARSGGSKAWVLWLLVAAAVAAALYVATR